MKINVSTNYDSLLALKPTHTIEAEYDKGIVNGSLVTLARSIDGCSSCVKENIPPCHLSITNGEDCNNAQTEGLCHRDCLIPTWTIGLGNIGLNTLGGVMRVLNRKNIENNRFWDIVGDIDIKGIDNLPMITSIDDTKELVQLKAFWAWSEANCFSPPIDDNVIDATEYVLTALDALKKIFTNEQSTSNA